VREAWLERAGPLGEAMSVNAASGPVSGTFGGLDADGALLLDTDDGRQLSFTFGDVTLAAKDDHA
jgi:BirA family biotin operon repressor/biotin-[acetyl-CoA-carboxylase] ligase